MGWSGGRRRTEKAGKRRREGSCRLLSLSPPSFHAGLVAVVVFLHDVNVVFPCGGVCCGVPRLFFFLPSLFPFEGSSASAYGGLGACVCLSRTLCIAEEQNETKTT